MFSKKNWYTNKKQRNFVLSSLGLCAISFIFISKVLSLCILLSSFILFGNSIIYHKEGFDLLDILRDLDFSAVILAKEEGVFFDRYKISLNRQLSFLEFKTFSSLLTKKTGLLCYAYKQNGDYFIDITKKNCTMNLKNNICMQTNVYNLYDFMGNRIFMSIHKNILAVGVDALFFRETILHKTTNCDILDNIKEVIDLIKIRLHTILRGSNNCDEIDRYYFLFIKLDEDILKEDLIFILKHGKKAGVFLIMEGSNERLINYGGLFDYIVYTDNRNQIYNTEVIKKNIPVGYLNTYYDRNLDVILFNRYYYERICIVK